MYVCMCACLYVCVSVADPECIKKNIIIFFKLISFLGVGVGVGVVL